MPATPLTLHHGSCLDVLPTIADSSVDSIVTDPPYELGFMGKTWDASGIAYNVKLWRQCLRVLKPGGHLLAFGGTRTYHRMACAIEDAGFEIRDNIHWLYGSGFPKSLDVSKAIDKAAGATREVVGTIDVGPDMRGGNYENALGRMVAEITEPSTDAAKQWEGWGTALKPAHEPIVVARKPLAGTVAANVLEHGTGALNIDGCRIATDDRFGGGAKASGGFVDGYESGDGWTAGSGLGRWPANVVLTHAVDCDMDDDCGSGCPVFELDAQSGHLTSGVLQQHHRRAAKAAGILGAFDAVEGQRGYGDSGGASRFFAVSQVHPIADVPFRYVPKPDRGERDAGLGALPTVGTHRYGEGIGGGLDPSAPAINRNFHPTVKPIELMRWLVRLVTPPNGTVLDPFAGSGTTLVAARLEGFASIGIEMTAEYLPIIEGRLAWAEEQAVQLSLFGEEGAA